MVELVINAFDFSIDDKLKKIRKILNKFSEKTNIKLKTYNKYNKNIKKDIERYQKLKIHLKSLVKKKL